MMTLVHCASNYKTVDGLFTAMNTYTIVMKCMNKVCNYNIYLLVYNIINRLTVSLVAVACTTFDASSMIQYCTAVFRGLFFFL